MTTNVFLERRFSPAIDRDDVIAMASAGSACFALHGVGWNGSYLAEDGRRLLCWFAAPDAESARNALRQVDADITHLWPGTVHEVADPVPPNVVVERRFAQPVTLEEIQAVEDAAAGCLETHRVRFARTFFSRDRKRMLCLYAAPDAESVRLAQRQAQMPVERVWAFRRIGIEDLASRAS
jgi:hypothetical protein